MALRSINPLLLLPVSFALLFSMPSQAQQRPSRVVTKTRLQVLFLDLESQWLEAVQAKDKLRLGKLLSDTFEIWTPTQADPVPLDDWRQRAFARPPKTFDVRQIAVRAVSNDVAVVSFVLNQTFAGGASSENQFVVDIWKNETDGWRCTDRYLSHAPRAEAAPEDVRPNGKQ
jgi:hypothetical protein